MVLVLAALSYAAMFLLNKGELDRVSAPRISISPDKVVDAQDIPFGAVVEIKGTPDLLNAVSMEDKDSNAVLTYFVPFKEYGTNYVVEVKQNKLRSTEQTFTGTATGLTQTQHENRIRNRLNRAIELSDDDRADLDADTIQILTDQTTNEFTSKTLIIQDEKLPDANRVYATVIFWGTLLLLGATTLFRKSIFQ